MELMMTDEEAQTEALKRWGDRAITAKNDAPLFPAGFLFKVGKRKELPNGGDYVALLGLGQSWEEAFAKADRYAERTSHEAR